MAKRNPTPTITVDVVTATIHLADAAIAARALREYAFGARRCALDVRNIDAKGSDHCADLLRRADSMDRTAEILFYAR